jgi:hypothetical protein
MRNWSIRRWFYVGAGLLLMALSWAEKQTYGMIFGAYFAFMGIFNFGCASGNCVPSSRPPRAQEQNTKDITFEEVK